MKFLVVGHLCMDVIHPPEGPEAQSYGGIYYSIATLASLLDDSDTVIPVFGVNKGDYQPLLQHLSQFSNVDPSGIFRFDEPTNQVHLFYKDGGRRIECSKHIAKPIPYEKIRRRLSVDGVLVNMISGFDLTIETLDHIRMAVRGHDIPIHFDYHSLTLGIKEDFERFRKPLEDWRRWAFMTDTLQFNEEEIAGLSMEGMQEEQTVGHLLTLSVKAVLITRGGRGATVYYSDKKRVMRNDVDGNSIGQLKDSTGCGDVFGAAFLLHYVRSHDLLASAKFANHVASKKAEQVGSDNMQALKNIPLPA